MTLTACGDPDEARTPASGSGIGSITGVSAGGSSGDAEVDESGSAMPEGSDDDAGDSAGPPAFDIGGVDDGGESPPEAGCQRVDFLFVIDNSASMENNQAALVGAFPGFMDAIQAALGVDSDYHILATDTDAWGRCNTVNGFNGMDPSSDTCNNYIENTPFEECDAVRGAGVVHPAGQHATNGPCDLSGGHRYMGAAEPDLAAAFACVGKVGVAGHPSERPMDSMVAALSSEINDVGACNEGFLRDDALLVVAFVSDDPHYEDSGTPAQWYQSVLDAKLGDPSSVVMLGLTPAWDGCADGGNTKGTHWKEFVEMWGDHGVHGNVCGTAQEYVAFFQSAVGTIDQACDDYQPPG
jgi:hypothetical protein